MTGSDGRKLGMMVAAILGAACSTGAAGSGTSTGTTTHGGTGAKTTSRTTTTSSVATTGGGGMGGMGGSAPVCNPPAADGSFYAASALQYGNPGPTSMCDYRGDVVLVVNTADV